MNASPQGLMKHWVDQMKPPTIDKAVVPGFHAKWSQQGETASMDFGKGLFLRFVRVPPSSFSESRGKPPKPISRAGKDRRAGSSGTGFWMSTTEITQEIWERVFKNDPSCHRGAQLPVESIPWGQAVYFCDCLSSATGKTVRLPTKTEWVYASLAGNPGDFFFGGHVERLKEYSWYDMNSDFRNHPVGQKKPNPWGLYDIYGNVAEWCGDAGLMHFPSGSLFGKQGYTQVVTHPALGGSCFSALTAMKASAAESKPVGAEDPQTGFRILAER